MAKVDVLKTALSLNQFSELTFTAGTTDGFRLDATPADNKLLIVFQNTAGAAGTVTMKQGNGIQGVADLDTFSIPANSFAAIRVDSGAFKNVSGDDKDYIIAVPSAATIKACVVQLP